MKKGSILGYDINEKICQISYFDEKSEEPVTTGNAVEHYQIPLYLVYIEKRWVCGAEAKRLDALGWGESVTDLFACAMRRERVSIGGKDHDSVWLLAKFIKLTLKDFEDIAYITFTVPETSVDVSKMLQSIGRHIGIPKERICVQDYKESFCHYMFYQPKELWQYESALFFCDGQKLSAYMLRKMNVYNNREKEIFVAVDEVADVHIKELEAFSPYFPMEEGEKTAKTADERFKRFIQSVFEKKVVSSVYLTGDAFEKEWYPDSLKVLCNGRRAFAGNNLYSKGACYASYHHCAGEGEGPIYLDATTMAQQISLRMRVDGKECWYPIVTWGTRWYEADNQWEVLLEDASDLEVHIESLASDELQVETISLEGLEERTDYSLRLQLQLIFLDERTCRLQLRDIGFGDFYPATGFQVGKEIHLGGSHGQFNSMS